MIADNVGDIAGTGSNIFSSYVEYYYDALVVASISFFGINHKLTPMTYSHIVNSVGIIVCLIIILFATAFLEIKAVKEIRSILKNKTHHFHCFNDRWSYHC